jgi:hypothetical protein
LVRAGAGFGPHQSLRNARPATIAPIPATARARRHAHNVAAANQSVQSGADANSIDRAEHSIDRARRMAAIHWTDFLPVPTPTATQAAATR